VRAVGILLEIADGLRTLVIRSADREGSLYLAGEFLGHTTND